MNEEIIFNLYVYSTNDIINKIGAVTYSKSGSDEEKLLFLQTRVYEDLKIAQIFNVPESYKLELANGDIITGILKDRYLELQHNSSELFIFEEAFKKLNAPKEPLICITSVVDGDILIEGKSAIKPYVHSYVKSIYEHVQPDYKELYKSDTGFHFGKLINDDFLEAIVILYEHDKYVSSAKLLMSSIDTFSYLEYGDVNGSFKMWIDSFCDLSKMGISSDELWEFRNSILHMTNLNSRKVDKKVVRRLLLSVNSDDVPFFREAQEGKYVNYRYLIDIITKALGKWAENIKSDDTKIEAFFERYNSIISDKRKSITIIEKGDNIL